MKKIILTLITSIVISFSVSAQTAGDYRSIGSGNWNDAIMWEIFNGSNWVSTAIYPGQNSGAAGVAIMPGTEIKITESVPYAVGFLLIEQIYYYDDDFNEIYEYGSLNICAANAVSLIVSGGVGINGQLFIENQNGAKTHHLSVGGNFSVWGSFYSFDEDDKLAVTFNTTEPNSTINGERLISFQDVTFNGIGIIFDPSISITGTATFINGIVKHGGQGNSVIFYDNAIASGASNASFVDGGVQKIGDDPFTFPTGREGIYAPLTMSAPVGQTESFDVLYMRRSGAEIGSITDAGLYSISNCEYWFFSNTVSNNLNFSLQVTVGWTAASGCGSPPDYIPNVSEVTLARCNGVSWDSHGGAGTGTTTNGSVTWADVTSCGIFSLGNVGISCGTPSGLTAYNITSNSATLGWSAVTGSVSYDVHYRAKNVYSSWLSVAAATTSTSVNLTGLSPLVDYEWKVRANCSSISSSYREAQFTTTQAPPPPPPVCNDVYEINNTSTQAKTISLGSTISAAISSAADVDWFKVTTPNNSNTNLEVTLSNLPADYDLYVYNKSLKLVGSSVNAGTANEVVIYNSNARKATYYIKIVGKNGAYNTSQCYSLLAQVSGTAGSASGKSYPANEVTDISDKQLLYPNPASEFVMLHFNSIEEGPVNVQILNTAGQLVKQSVIKITKGYNQVKLAVNDIKQGMYILRINKGDLNLTRKFVIAR